MKAHRNVEHKEGSMYAVRPEVSAGHSSLSIERDEEIQSSFFPI